MTDEAVPQQAPPPRQLSFSIVITI